MYYDQLDVRHVDYHHNEIIVIQSYTLLNSPIFSFNQRVSSIPSPSSIYSTWIVHKVTTNCKLAFQQITVPNCVKTYPKIDFLVSTFHA